MIVATTWVVVADLGRWQRQTKSIGLERLGQRWYPCPTGLSHDIPKVKDRSVKDTVSKIVLPIQWLSCWPTKLRETFVRGQN